MAVASGRVIRREASQESRRRIVDARGADHLHEICYLSFRHRIAFQGNLSCAAAQQQPEKKTTRFDHIAEGPLVAHRLNLINSAIEIKNNKSNAEERLKKFLDTPQRHMLREPGANVGLVLRFQRIEHRLNIVMCG